MMLELIKKSSSRSASMLMMVRYGADVSMLAKRCVAFVYMNAFLGGPIVHSVVPPHRAHVCQHTCRRPCAIDVNPGQEYLPMFMITSAITPSHLPNTLHHIDKQERRKSASRSSNENSPARREVEYHQLVVGLERGRRGHAGGAGPRQDLRPEELDLPVGSGRRHRSFGESIMPPSPHANQILQSKVQASPKPRQTSLAERCLFVGLIG